MLRPQITGPLPRFVRNMILKKKTRQANAERKRNLYGTGGGKPPSPTDDVLNSLMGSSGNGMESVTDCDLLYDTTGSVKILLSDNEWAASGTSVGEPPEAEQQHTQTSEDLDWGDFSVKMLKTPRNFALQTTGSAERKRRLDASPSMSSRNVLSWAKEWKEVAILQQQLLQKEFNNRQEREQERHEAEMEELRAKRNREQELH